MPSNHLHPALLAAFLLTCSASVQAVVAPRGAPHVETFPPGAAATVAHVIDGDTAWFRLTNGDLVKARFIGLNAPECHKRQISKRGLRSASCDKDHEFYGLASARAMQQILAAGPIRLHCPRTAAGGCQQGGFGRPLVTVDVGGKDAAAEMIRVGAGWTYTKYPDRNRAKLCRIEAQARAAKVGMWATDLGRIKAGMLPKTRKWFAGQATACAAAR